MDNQELKQIQKEILELEQKRILNYTTKDLKYGSWQFIDDILKEIKQDAKKLKVHQSQLVRYIVDEGLKKLREIL